MFLAPGARSGGDKEEEQESSAKGHNHSHQESPSFPGNRVPSAGRAGQRGRCPGRCGDTSRWRVGWRPAGSLPMFRRGAFSGVPATGRLHVLPARRAVHPEYPKRRSRWPPSLHPPSPDTSVSILTRRHRQGKEYSIGARYRLVSLFPYCSHEPGRAEAGTGPEQAAGPEFFFRAGGFLMPVKFFGDPGGRVAVLPRTLPTLAPEERLDVAPGGLVDRRVAGRLTFAGHPHAGRTRSARRIARAG